MNQLTAEDWDHLRRTMEYVANAVMIAHPGGGKEERLALNHEWAEGPKRFPRNEFIFELFLGMPDELHQLNEPKREGASTEQIVTDAVTMCQHATSIVQTKIPQEEENFRTAVHMLITKIASASKEGGILGVGGKWISEREKAVIDRITAVLPPER